MVIKEVPYGTSILREMPILKRDEGCQSHNHEERQAGDPRRVPYLRYQDDQDRKDLKETLVSIREKVGFLLVTHPIFSLFQRQLFRLMLNVRIWQLESRRDTT
jgi:hypothetical protein